MDGSKLVTLTFGDQAENHRGMEKRGELAAVGEGFDIADLDKILKRFPNQCSVVDLHNVQGVDKKLPEAFVFVLHNGVDLLGGYGTHKRMFDEQMSLDWDKKALMYGNIRNKHARWNLCYDDEHQEPDIMKGKGRVYAFSEVPILTNLRVQIEKNFGNKAKDLKCEGNFYYDISNCGIGFHGDAERRKVIGVRLGAPLPIYYQWFYNGSAIGPRIEIPLDGGDIYIMSEKAVGTDWRMRIIPTLRHAVGSKKYTNVDIESLKEDK